MRWSRIGVAHQVERMAQHVKLVELEAIVAHVELVVVGSDFVNFADVLPLSLVHVCEISKDVPLGLLLTEDTEHLEGGLGVKAVAVLALDDLLALHVGQPCEMLVIDVLDVDPLDLEVPLEFERVVLPPVGESFLVVA